MQDNTGLASFPAAESCKGIAAVSVNGVARDNLPLVVDLDGTLTPVDTLVESVLKAIKSQPLVIFRMLVWLTQGLAAFKRNVCALAPVDVESLPWRQDLLAYVTAAHLAGRKVILATASDRRTADAVSKHLKVFDYVLASDGVRNLKAGNKLTAIVELIGADFVYAGDSNADLAVWRGAKRAILVGNVGRIARKIRIPVESTFASEGVGLNTWVRALRMHQYVKNLLLFVPLLTSFAFLNLQQISAAVQVYVAFCLVASATYIANDLWDLESDRAHPRKRRRPFASGELPVPQGLTVGLILLCSGLLIAAHVSTPTCLMLLGYVGMTTWYSWSLKRYVLLDVLCLAMLYMWRVLAGATAAQVVVSPWLLAFSVFIFASLALVKRCAELVSLKEEGKSSSKGRDYGTADLVVLLPLGVCLGLCSVVVFGLYVGSPGATSLYANLEILWLVGLGLLYWIGRLWIKTARGEMHDDPIVFALRDFGSRVTLATMVSLIFAAHFIR